MNSNDSHISGSSTGSLRLKVVVRGAVQGVGFRPFVHRLATQLRLSGWVSNSSQGVFIEVEGPKTYLDKFLIRLESDKPAIAYIQSLESVFLDAQGFTGFEIRKSQEGGEKTALILPDIATCPDCLSEVFNPNDRRHLYPFTNCTNCGPRFSIITSLPYDRNNTSMKMFVMCPECRREYEDPTNRRFHAQPNACPACGPSVELWSEKGACIAGNLKAFLGAVEILRQGKIVAVKGIGGFQFLVDARSDDAVARLRERKRREEKPFALMFPTLDDVRHACAVSSLEERLLRSAESPIVLLRKLENEVAKKYSIDLVRLSSLIAPRNPNLGIMLPYSPLHHILMKELRFPVVATSGNVSDEPICTDEFEAVHRLNGIADAFLVHNRPIVRHVDDSIVRILLGRELVLRRARGFAPLPVQISSDVERPIVAVGAHLKNTIAVAKGRNIFISQHIGDLETHESFDAFQSAIRDFRTLYGIQEPQTVCDMHPDYLSTKQAATISPDVTEIQHHYAHIASCMAENQINGPVLGVSWDGTGFGTDGSIWGGEFLVTNDSSFERIGTFRQFGLPGGDKAVREPRRSAIGVLFEIIGPSLFALDDVLPLRSFSDEELRIIRTMLEKSLNSPRTSSVGRLFDAVASIIGLKQIGNFEGQAAMELEFLASRTHTDEAYPFELTHSTEGENLVRVDWRPVFLAIMNDVRGGIDTDLIAAKFHNALADIVVAVAQRVKLERVVLSGGCFQNAYLTERCVRILERSGFHPYWHQRIPPNDGGISLGQIYALTRLDRSKSASQFTLFAAEATQ